VFLSHVRKRRRQYNRLFHTRDTLQSQLQTRILVNPSKTNALNFRVVYMYMMYYIYTKHLSLHRTNLARHPSTHPLINSIESGKTYPQCRDLTYIYSNLHTTVISTPGTT
jgi:hypothetical protein